MRTLAIDPFAFVLTSSFPCSIKARRRFSTFLHIRTIEPGVSLVEETDLTFLECPNHFSVMTHPTLKAYERSPFSQRTLSLLRLPCEIKAFDVAVCGAVNLGESWRNRGEGMKLNVMLAVVCQTRSHQSMPFFSVHFCEFSG